MLRHKSWANRPDRSGHLHGITVWENSKAVCTIS